jgi:formylglycine-generating enzyme required for sulfatase activity
VAVEFDSLAEAEKALERLRELHYVFATVQWGRLIEPVDKTERRSADPFSQRSRPPKRSITNSIGMILRLIPPTRRFKMGSKEGKSDETPVHGVAISKAYYIGQYEVTQGQYEQVTGRNPSKFKGRNLPVEMVSWEDANEFCRLLSETEDAEYRLPTEAEWEWACRANRTTEYYWGDKFSPDYAFASENSGGKTHPVGSLKPNRFGLHDMSGNVWEWCSDYYSPTYSGSQTDPQGPASGVRRVLRGGSWRHGGSLCRSASRYAVYSGEVDSSHGFRVVREIDMARDEHAASSRPTPFAEMPPYGEMPAVRETRY